MFGRMHRAQSGSGHPARACLLHWCCRTVLPDGFCMLVCRKNFVLHHRKIGVISSALTPFQIVKFCCILSAILNI